LVNKQWVEALKLIETAADTYLNYKSLIALKKLFPCIIGWIITGLLFLSDQVYT